ncbi:hypothetical protein Fcan01_02821 [Folsomia candida]|uniref:Uncharacterized protein n=1 Tax=Folsomia candida TaxID=158441 RepID=A0A226F0C7_FOLCA|nr:hypothetical protein Fcan01_02821 [Folsomia candida]
MALLATPYRAEIKEILEGPSASGDLALLAGEGFSGTQGAALVNGVVSKLAPCNAGENRYIILLHVPFYHYTPMEEMDKIVTIVRHIFGDLFTSMVQNKRGK